MLENALEFIRFYWRDGVTILVLWLIVYQCYKFFHSTRGARALAVLIAAWIVMALLSELLDLVLLGWILKSISVFLAVAMVVIFQPELRRAVTDLGNYGLFSSFNEGGKEITQRLAEMVELLSNKRIGALIAIQRAADLKPILETGVTLDCKISEAIVHTIFYPGTALHDGGLVMRLRDERLLAAGCVFPLTQHEFDDRSIGLRHRAAMGVTEESDAIAVVVSEETGGISLAFKGKLERNLRAESLRERLNELLFEGDEQDDEKDVQEEAAEAEETKPTGKRRTKAHDETAVESLES